MSSGAAPRSAVATQPPRPSQITALEEDIRARLRIQACRSLAPRVPAAAAHTARRRPSRMRRWSAACSAMRPLTPCAPSRCARPSPAARRVPDPPARRARSVHANRCPRPVVRRQRRMCCACCAPPRQPLTSPIRHERSMREQMQAQAVRLSESTPVSSPRRPAATFLCYVALARVSTDAGDSSITIKNVLRNR